MKMKRTISILLALLVAAPVLAAKINIDYDKHADPTKYRTFQYMPPKDGDTKDQLMEDRIVSGLKKMLGDAGMREVDSNPDCYATYRVTTEERKSYTTTGLGYGYGPGWGPYYGGGWGVGMAGSTTTEQTWTDGTLLVELWDAETKHALWRGTSTSVVKSNPEKVADQIEDAFAKMLKKWQRMKKQFQKEKK